MKPSDHDWMNRALALAERGRGHVEPNPLVGAVLVRDGSVMGEGYHGRFGGPHAEVAALVAAGERSRAGTLYVTLEPCCHVGKTPPCADALVRAGVRRVVAAMEDPFVQVAGQGARRLREAGIEVELGVGADLARHLNAPYLKLLGSGRPYVHAKWAMSLDGKIATRAGDSKWISNEASRKRTHELRGRMDAVVVGIGTALADDPLLTARPPGPRVATRVVLDAAARLPESSKLFQSARAAPLLVVVADGLAGAAIDRIRSAGAEVVPCFAVEGKLDLAALLDELGRRRMTNVLFEGGAQVLGSLADGRLIDAAHIFIAPYLIGGATATPALAGRGFERLVDVFRFDNVAVERLDGNLAIRAWRSM
jgi:diaminohydroxyphosphoribosylaminopyrimidine deaminase/5-amino-6-(5-phosphoribosylamino)uracil reductase